MFLGDRYLSFFTIKNWAVSGNLLATAVHFLEVVYSNLLSSMTHEQTTPTLFCVSI